MMCIILEAFEPELFSEAFLGGVVFSFHLITYVLFIGGTDVVKSSRKLGLHDEHE